ncbi:6-bladed beta-propeller [Prolixibacter denitrificans]|uniref:6-bladed beta-propeller protein n=1 Tax=Prolixibacter denitrificans TaxID=1541063 RepID=A0A2P8CBZ5_9BACT|nr:6-bladed beta-propeller [Prolixibacter denitrificans]PSK82477.1 6-bladed beta-propeller protein [Prolixibacter denitrificans]GET22779.1 hypothetical protein JCM18694_30250 [Prolixibacter denitrificans]
MYPYLKFFVLVASVTLFGCATKTSNQKPEEVKAAQINFSDIQSPTDGFSFINQIDTIQFIPLEFQKECAITKVSKLVVFDDTLYVSSLNDLYLFSMQGKFLKRFAKQGKGPGEYLSLMDFTIDGKNRRLSLYDYLQNKLQVYRLDGSYIKSIPLGYVYAAEVTDSSRYLAYPFNLMGNEPNKLLLLNEKGDTLKTFPNPQSYPFKSLFLIQYFDAFYHFDHTLQYRQFLSDTLYAYHPAEQALRPRFIFHGFNTLPLNLLGDQEAFEKQEKSYSWLEAVRETGRYLFLYEKDKDTYRKLVYDKREGKLYEVDNSPMDKAFTGPLSASSFYWPNRVINGNEWMRSWSAVGFKTFFKQMAGDSTSLATLKRLGVKDFNGFYDSVNENDNPVLLWVKLK